MPNSEADTRPDSCPSKACPVESENLLLRQQRNEDSVHQLGDAVKTLVNKIDSLVDRIAAQELTATKINTLERDVGHAFRDLRELKEKFDATRDQIIEEVKKSLDGHKNDLEDFKKEEFSPIRTQFNQWKGAVIAVGGVLVVCFGLAQYIAFDKFSQLADLSTKVQVQEVELAKQRMSFEGHRTQNERDIGELFSLTRGRSR